MEKGGNGMYTRQPGEGAGKILLRPNQAPQTDKASQKAESAEQKEESVKENVAQAADESSSSAKKHRAAHYKARRPQKSEAPEKDPPACVSDSQSDPDDRTRNTENLFLAPSCNNHVQQKSGISALLSSYTTDELMIFAIIILLIMQGSDDILVLALCFVIL